MSDEATMTHRVHARIDRVDPSIIARFRDVKYELIADFVAPTQLMDPAIKPLALREMRFVGSAVTVAMQSAGTFMGFAALGVAQPGDVIIVAVQGDCSQASWGGGYTLSAKGLGVAAIVVDGAVIDTPSILSRDVPVFARGATYAHPPERKLGSVNVPTNCGGVMIYPGDIVLGDLDGVAVVPRADAESVLLAAEEKTAFLKTIAARIVDNGETLLDINGGRSLITDSGVEWID